MRDEPPTGDYRLASHYLLETGRLKRRETTVDVYLADVGARTIDVECSIPNYGWGSETWYLPVAVFPKEEVAPDLEVTACDGQIVAIPTKQQNLALTERAIEEMIDSGKLEIDLESIAGFLGRPVDLDDVKDFFAEVISDEPVFARGRRLAYEEVPGRSQAVVDLMRRLEDNFVLWVPTEGRPQSHHHFRIRRREIRPLDQIIAPKLTSVIWEDETALGPIEVESLSAEGPPWPRLKSLFNRLPNTVAVRPIEARPVDLEARRAGSCHVRVNAPPGFLVRNIRVGGLVSSPAGYPEVEELFPQDEEVVIQGWDQNLAHVQVFKEENPEELHCFVTLGPRGGAITLWMVAAVFTAALLWTVHHAFKTGAPASPAPPEHFVELIGSILGDRKTPEGDYLPVSSTGKQILAGVLLVGPAFASAWSLRADGGEMIRSFFSGAQLLFLTSAALSVFAALALAGVVKDSFTAIELCAAASYVVATPLVGAWLLARSTLWVLFRFVFDKESHNIVAVEVLALAIVAAGVFDNIPDGCTGLIVVVSGMALAMIGANSAAEPLRAARRGNLYRSVAGFGSIPIIVLAGSFLGFYGRLLHPEDARIWCILVGAVVALAPLVAWLLRKPAISQIIQKISLRGLRPTW